jgi:hypothetical protein
LLSPRTQVTKRADFSSKVDLEGGRTNYQLHNTNLEVGKTVARLIGAVRNNEGGSRFIGWDKDEEGHYVAGTGTRYKELIVHAARLIKSTPLLKEGFTYSSLGLACGKAGVEEILGEAAVGERACWLWSKGGQGWLRVDGSKKFNGNSKITVWPKTAKLRLHCDPVDIFGLTFFHGIVNFRLYPGGDIFLQKYGFIPNPLEEDAGSSTTLEEVDQHEEKDPTEGLPEMKIADAWVKDGPPQKGAGWWGKGAPIQVQQSYKVRDFADGAGLCSPGRWQPSKRRLPAVGGLAKEVVEHMGLSMEEWSKTAIRMMAGKLEQDPFSEEQMLKGRCFMEAWCKGRGCPVQEGPKDIHQEPKLRLLQAFLRVCGDPDAEALDIYCVGVRLGHKLKMPRTPAIFPKKEKWRIKFVDLETVEDQWAPNYKTARERMAVLQSKVSEDVAEGRMKKMTFKEAKETYGKDLLIGALGLVDEGKEKID